MLEERHSVDDVYGITRELPKNYTERKSVDDKLKDDLGRGKHVAIYGSSKQGKTCLRKHCIDEDDCIVVQCNNNWDLKEIHTAILKRAGYEVTLSEKKTISGTQKIKAKLGGSWFGGSVSSETKASESKSTTTRELELDPSDVNDIIRALEEVDFDKYVILEDYHYLPVETQKDFAVALKAFHEASSLCFVIVGVWLEENRLIVHNGDLTGRVVAVNADEWQHNQLRRVIERGEKMLNVNFNLEFKDDLIENCFDSVYIVQETCRNVCLEEGVTETQESVTRLAEDRSATEVVKGVVSDQEPRYRSFLRKFKDGFQKTELEMYKWILYPVLTSETSKLRDGILYSEMREKIEDKHPRGTDLNPGNLTQALQSTASLQVKKDIKPIILDYDQTNRRLSVVDRGFLTWVSSQDMQEVLEMAGLDDIVD